MFNFTYMNRGKCLDIAVNTNSDKRLMKKIIARSGIYSFIVFVDGSKFTVSLQ